MAARSVRRSLPEPWDKYELEPVDSTPAEGTKDSRWVLPGVLPRGTSLIYGGEWENKNIVATDLALCLATGTPWLGRFPTQRTDVLYISSEGGHQKRLKGWLAHHNLEKAERMRVLAGAPPLRNDGGLARLLDAERAKAKDAMDEAAATFEPGLVVIDTLNRLIGSEYNLDGLQRFFLACRWITDTTGASVLVLQHYDELTHWGIPAPERLAVEVDALFALDGGILYAKEFRGDRQSTYEIPITFKTVTLPLSKTQQDVLSAFRESDSTLVVASGTSTEAASAA